VRRKPAAIDTKTNWLRVSTQQNKRRTKMTQARKKKKSMTTRRRTPTRDRSRSRSMSLDSSLMSLGMRQVDRPWNSKQPKEPEPKQEEPLAMSLQRRGILWPKTTIWCA
jgi:hypothetical protein